MLSLLSCPPVAFQAGGAVLRTPSSAAASMQVGTAEPLSRGTNALEDYQLRAIYQRADADGSGEVDREELTSALFAVGYRLDVDEYAAMFDEADVDGGGTITFEEFKDFIVKKPPPPITKSQQFAMELFYKYDVDEGGTIDLFEFAGLAEEVEKGYRRRNFLTGVGALLGGLVVARYDSEYAFLQKQLRGLYIEKEAEASQNSFFPTAMLSSDLNDAVSRTLSKRGFTPQNTLFGHSVCSDEVNNKDEQLIDLMVTRWQEGFSLGGLGGLPFAGKSGFRAFLHHSPDNGKLLILFAPHVGIDDLGRVGALQREGQSAVSKACGAALGSYKAIQAKGGVDAPESAVKELDTVDNTEFDPELEVIISLLKPRLKGVEQAPEPITFVTYQMYTIVRDLLDNCIKETPDVWDWVTEYAIVGGIMVNRRTGGDFFQPLSFELRTPDEDRKRWENEDIFVEAFGPKPDLLPVLGSAGPVKDVLYAKTSVNRRDPEDALVRGEGQRARAKAVKAVLSNSGK
jgi:Ca2+-binding EF-hand superfamily protein